MAGEIEIIIIAVVILVIAWIITRLNSQISQLKDDINLLRKRLLILNTRLDKAGSGTFPARSEQDKSRNAYGIDADSSENWESNNLAPQVKNYLEQKEKSGTQTICSKCGKEYSPELDKCPKCHYINVEKFGLRTFGQDNSAKDAK
ncbi:hypothetical protein JW877_01250 [bacterium]|nr:hypothetical protein [bacterium]